MKEKSTFSHTLTMIVIGMGLIAVGVAAMTLLTLRRTPKAGGSDTSVIPARVNYPAPELTLNDLGGTPRSLTNYLGQVVLVNMWASWCPPCVAELPTLNAYHEAHAGDGFLIIGINDGEEYQVVKDYVTRAGLVFPVWVDPTWLSEQAFNTMNLPSSFVIDRTGQIRLQWVGAINRETLDEYVTPIINE